MSRELTQDEILRINTNFINGLNSDPANISKEASLINQHIVLKILREDGISRKFLKYEPITPMDLDTDFNNPDILTKFVPIEDPVSSYLAMSTDWLQPTKDIWFNSKFFRIRFYPMVSRRIKMTESQILGARYPIREYLEGVIKNDFLAVEDFQFIDNLERCLLQQSILYNDSGVVSISGGKLVLSAIADLAKKMVKRRLGIDCLFVNEATFYDFYKTTQNEAGSFIQKDLYDSGIMGPDRRFKAFGGFKWLLTNNSDIIPENVVYAVAPQRMLGKFYQLQTPQTYIKYENHILQIYSRQILGRGIANINAVAKLVIN